ncbi:MAG: response regulator [Planctomycetes bacterium]|nr:response regulator [Planctomycetota bacterium]
MAAMDSPPGDPAEVDIRQVGIGGLPNRLRLLCVGSSEPSWISLALNLDALGCHEPSFRWVSTANEALSLLRDESFDCLLLRTTAARSSAEEDPLTLARGIRAGGYLDPIVVVTTGIDDASWTEALRLNVDLLVSAKGWESSALIQTIQRAVERGRMLHEIDRLSTADRRRLVRERDEADQLLEQQRRILQGLERHLQTTTATLPLTLPPAFDEYYQELLRTYVIMGSGNLSGEIAKLAELLAQAGLTPPQVLRLHLDRVEQLVRGLGNRSTRHVMSRVDLLALELMVNLGECYQRQQARQTPDSATVPTR